MNTIKRIGLAVVCAGSLALVVAAPAAAFPPVGTDVTGVEGGRGIEFGALTTCGVSLSGVVTRQEMFGGGEIRVDRIAFTGCSSGASVTANALPWSLGADPTAAAGLGPVDVNITTSRGACRYSGNLLGSITELGSWFVSGDVRQRAAGCGGADQLATSVGLRVRDSEGNPVGP
jgi:hypothetical protein